MMTSRRFGSRNGRIHARAWIMLATMFLLSSIAPFATPVVPPVYCRNAMSSWLSGTRSSARPRPAASASDSRIEPFSVYAGTIFLTRRSTKSTISPLKPSSSPIDVTTTCFTPVLPITCDTVLAKFSTQTSTVAPESFN